MSSRIIRKTIALVDPLWSGHHPTYLQLFSNTLLGLGHRVYVYCPNPDLLKAMIFDLQPSPPLNRWTGIRYAFKNAYSFETSRIRKRRRALEHVSELASLLSYAEQKEKITFDMIFFCYLDSFLGNWQTARAFNKRLGRPFSGLYFHPIHLRKRIPRSRFRMGLLNPDAVLYSRLCPAVAVLDEGIANDLSKRLKGKMVIPFPDVTNTTQKSFKMPLEQQVLEKAQGRKVIGLLGSLEKRKGTLDFLQLALSLTDHPLFFVLAGCLEYGTFSKKERALIDDYISHTPHNVFFSAKRIVDESEFNSLIRACDFLYAVYHEFPHSSNLLAKAAFMRVPIVVSDRYLMGERVRRFHLGFTVNENKPEDLHVLMTKSKTFTLCQDIHFQCGCNNYLYQHSMERLSECFIQLLTA